MKYTFAILVIILVSCSAPAQLEEELSALDTEVPKLLEQLHTAGIAVTVFNKNEILYNKGFGYADYEKKIPMDGNTILGIGSCSKSFTASLLGQLEDKGKLSFQDKPSKYIKGLMFSNIAQNEKIQITNLLKHSTGLSVMSCETTAILFETEKVDDYINRIAHVPVVDEVGNSFHYNNLMYHIAARVGEECSSKSWESLLNTEIFTPLEMTNTYPTGELALKSPLFGLGYAVDSITPARVPVEIMPARKQAGSIHSSANDMSKWVQLWMNNGVYRGKQILTKRYISRALTDVQIMSNANDSVVPEGQTYYGYGWMISNYNGHKRVQHGGGVSGYTSNMTYFPDDNLGIVVLSNQTTSPISSHVTNLISHYLLKNIPEPKLDEQRPSQMHFIGPIDTPTITDTANPPSKPLKAYTGSYFHPAFGTIEIVKEGETLYADFPMTRFRLEHQENDEFFDFFTEEIPLVMWSFMRFRFKKNERGDVDKLLLNFNDPLIVFSKVN